MKYRPEIDGLRAIAVIPVILFHAGFSSFSGGFVGVDIFFVISGYLITTILVEEMSSGKFRISGFYERRARRILPALYFLLLFSVVLGLYMSPLYARDLYQSVFATILFSENILLYIESSNYFGLGSDYKPLLHMWTLAVEEQFYLLFPLLLLVVGIRRRRTLFVLFVVLIIASLFLFIFLMNEPLGYYMAYARAWEFLLGAGASLVVLSVNNESDYFLASFRNTISLIGLLFVMSAFVVGALGWCTCYGVVLSVIGTVIVIIFADADSFVAHVLGRRLFVGIGLISYGLYLWHQPIIVIYRIWFGCDSGDYCMVAPVFFAFSVALISFFFVEKPFRTKKHFSTLWFSVLMLFLSVILLLFSFYGHKSKGFESYKKAALGEERGKYYISHFDQVRRVHETDWGENGDCYDGDILVIGDSMASDCVAAFASVGVKASKVKLDGSHFREIVREGAVDELKVGDLLRAAASAKAVILASDFSGEGSSSGVKPLLDVLSDVAPTYVLGVLRFSNASDVSYRLALSNCSDPSIFAFNNLARVNYAANDTLKCLAGEKRFIDKYGMFCHEGRALLYDDCDQPLFYDPIHMTVEGWSFFGNKLLDALSSVLEVDSYK